MRLKILNKYKQMKKNNKKHRFSFPRIVLFCFEATVEFNKFNWNNSHKMSLCVLKYSLHISLFFLISEA